MKSIYFFDAAEDSTCSIDGSNQKELNAKIILVLEDQSLEILKLYNENLKLKTKLRKVSKMRNQLIQTIFNSKLRSK